MRKKVFRHILIAFTLALPAIAPAAEYKVDPSHTSVTFEIRHLFTTVRGNFRKFEGKIAFDPADPSKTKVEGTIDAASIDTNVEKRDAHLRGKDFFDVEKYPQITFASTKVISVDDKTKSGKLEGNLTMHGVTRPVVLDVAFLGEGKDPWGNTRAGFHAGTTINRKDFGLSWNETLETGSLLVGEEVKISLDVEGLRQ